MMETTGSLQTTLQDLLVRSEAFAVLLVTKDGKLVESTGRLQNVNTVALAALVAGMFGATREVARLVGEDHFCILLQQGQTRNIHIALLHNDMMLVILFEGHHRIGMVRSCANHALPGLVRHLTEVHKPTAPVEEGKFREIVSSLIDNIFTERDPSCLS
jgi:predicted regulator of Ras-like GTPase activity (Roadblock/LC7/MglB family)